MFRLACGCLNLFKTFFLISYERSACERTTVSAVTEMPVMTVMPVTEGLYKRRCDSCLAASSSIYMYIYVCVCVCVCICVACVLHIYIYNIYIYIYVCMYVYL
jgi:hypothetical protein